jgi:hypothetical protein
VKSAIAHSPRICTQESGTAGVRAHNAVAPDSWMLCTHSILPAELATRVQAATLQLAQRPLTSNKPSARKRMDAKKQAVPNEGVMQEASCVRRVCIQNACRMNAGCK